MVLIEINRDPTRSQVRQFAWFWLPGFCFLMAAWCGYRLASWPAAAVLLACGLASIALGLWRPSWMRIVFLGWMWAAFPVGWIIGHMLMAVVYFLVITPIGLAMRALGRDPLARRFEHGAQTYWTRRDQSTDPLDYFRQY